MMMLDADALAFLEKNRSAAMTTLRRDGSPHTVRVGVALVDGKIWSSGTATRLRTRHLRRDPRASLMVFDTQWAYLGIEARVRIIEGGDVPALSWRLFEVMQRDMQPAPPAGMLQWYGRPLGREEFERLMVEEGRLIYEFEPVRVYGLYRMPAGR